ncbi:helix-turn-helix domain-containing protein [Micromonospora sp. NEAU-HG-1]|uniref:helix-turn-helix domain-containing protein n=1 Tax=Micromonospora rubida TaxID=2697657 RepID=UPI0013790F2A|nr:helix-turn-helix transcriptional regulator [Micromonospora rubida]NBE84806.1 helix-turn-helix domain-containing protein [Micromonospora rubida]
MTGPGRRTGNELPIGLRMAELRDRRGMSQQVFADRIGKSKSWVDKVERGVRTLDRLSVIETVAAALAAATCGDDTTAGELTERAAHLATAHGEHRHHDNDGTGFGSTAVELARALTAMRLGDHHRAVTTHQRATSGDTWHRLPAEHRAAHLIDITHAHLDLGDPHAAGRALITADTIAPAETRTRPAAHTALTAVLRAGPIAADVARLAATIGLTRR